MLKISKNNLIELLAYFLLLLSALIYVFLREPYTYFSFLLQKLLGIGFSSLCMHIVIPKHLHWLIYSLPSGLWVMATTLLGRLFCRSNCSYLCLPILLVLWIECCQFLKITDGSFDWLDIWMSISGFLLAIIIPLDVSKNTKKRWVIAYSICILALPLSDVR
jgi:hypothetical protein